MGRGGIRGRHDWNHDKPKEKGMEPMATVSDQATGHTYAGSDAADGLSGHGILRKHWEATALAESVRARYDLDPAVGASQILSRCAPDLRRIAIERGDGSHAMGVPFVREHHLTEDEVRCAGDGDGLFTVRRDRAGTEILVRAGDLIAVPRGTGHWCTLTATRNRKAVRLFTDPAGWAALYDPPHEVTA
jgi:cupin superfamily acireductone dioxygenase involved in methionine salvage